MIAVDIPWQDPVDAFTAVCHDPFAVLLDSALIDKDRGRWSMIATDPFDYIRIEGDSLFVDPFAQLRDRMIRWKTATVPDAPPLGPGAIGFLAYEAARFVDCFPRPKPEGLDLPDLSIGFYDCVAVYDAIEHKSLILSTGWPETDVSAKRKRAEARAADLATRLAAPQEIRPIDGVGEWCAEMRPGVYRSGVRKIREHIAAGDIYQANLTQRFLARQPEGLEPFSLYRRLRTLSPAPFAAFLNLGHNRWIASASPERFLHVDPFGRIETRPIKGTRPRSKNPAQDIAMAAELMASEKDRSENLMIVDLLRNDLSRACVPGSIKVPSLCALETFASVHHLVSVVEGQLADWATSVDLLRLCYPGGSITGAPKLKAMEIINAIEPARRGAYCGSIVHLGFNGSMDSNIIIRTLCGANGIIAAQGGGGIVADSLEEAEEAEAMTKLAPLLAALRMN